MVVFESFRLYPPRSDCTIPHFVKEKLTGTSQPVCVDCPDSVGNEPFCVLLGDDIIEGPRPCTLQLLDIFRDEKCPVIALERVPRNRLGSYGVVEARPAGRAGLHQITGLVEKPDPSSAPSELAIMGRYVLTPEIFDCLERTPPGKGGEVQLTDALQLLLGRERMLGLEFIGRRYDIGDKLDWLKATFELALARNDLGPALEEHIKGLLDQRRKAGP